MNRFLLKKGKQVGAWVCTDLENKIVCQFEEHNFNGSQKITFLENNTLEMDALAIARAMREMADWLYANHKELL